MFVCFQRPRMTERFLVRGGGIKNPCLAKKWKEREKDKVMVKKYSFKTYIYIYIIYVYIVHANVNFHKFEVSIFSYFQ